jgi:nucleoside-diphosphate-sugar epimerase
MVGGDMTDPASVRRAMVGCDVVMHCALDNRTRGRALGVSSCEGTRNVMQAAVETGVRRVVHLSSAAVHGLWPEAGGGPTERSRLRRTGHDYCDAKIEAEGIALEHHRRHGLPVAVLRPTIVYGPFGFYSESPARVAREGRLVLVDGADGVCNCVYVDNVVQAMILAAEKEAAVGEVFHVSDARPVTWRQYLERHAGALGPEFVPLRVVSRRELQAARRELRAVALKRLLTSPVAHVVRLLRDPETKQGVLSVPGAALGADSLKAVLRMLPTRTRASLKGLLMKTGASGPGPAPTSPSGSLRTLTPIEEGTFSAFSRVTFGIEKAQRLLGYAPLVDFEEGMARTEDWIRWARI